MNLNDFEKSFSSSILARGNQLYRGKKFEYVEQDEDDPTVWYALIEGTHNDYELEATVQPNGQIIDYECECPYDWGGPCKHVAALLFEVRERIKKTASQVHIVPEKAVSRTTEEMMAFYEKLDDTSQKLMKVAAMLWEGTSKTKLMEIFNAANLKDEGKNIYPTGLNPRLEKLVKSGLLTTNFNNQYQCPENLSVALCDKYFDKDPEFKKTITPIQRLVPLNTYWYAHTEPERYFREMRFGRYTNNSELFQKNFLGLVNLGKRGFTQKTLCDHWLGDTFDQNKLEALPNRIRAFLLFQLLTIRAFNLTPFDAYFHYAMDKVKDFDAKDRPLLAHLLAQLNVLKGDWKQVERLSPYMDATAQGVYAGIGQLLAGKTDDALDTFTLAQKQYRKDVGSNKEVLHNLAGVFYVLTYLKTQDSKYYRRIHSHVKQVQRQQTSYHIMFDWLGAVVHFLENNKPLAVEILKKAKSWPLFDLFKYLCQFWVSESLLDLKEMAANCQEYHQRGYAWLASEVNAILGEMNQSVAGIPMPDTVPLYQILPRIEEWETALKVLLEMGGKATSTAASDSTDRIAWLVNFEVGTAQARHQTISKNGSWSKGRMVSFERLQRKEVPALTMQDERFISAVTYAWGSEINLHGELGAFKHLVGHPLLFLEKSPATAVQLVESKPMLIAKKTDKGYQLQFSEKIYQTGAQVIKESPTRYLFIEASEQVVQIARAFNGKSLHVPEKGADQLKEAISGLASIVQIQSTFEDENLPTVEADTRTCVHLLPIGNGFHVEVYVKPFKDVPPYVKPGEGEPYLISTVEGKRTATTRDLKAETDNLKTLRDKVEVLKKRRPYNGIWELENTETCLELLLQLKPLLETGEILLEWPKGEKFRVDAVVGFDKFKMSVNEKGTWFEVNGELRVDEEKVLTMQELLALSEQTSQFVEVSPGKFLALTEEFRNRLKSINGLLASQKKGGALQLHPLAAPAIESFTELIGDFSASQKFLDNKDRLTKAFSKKHKVPKAFNATLRPYQHEGFQWLHRCANWGVGACLADDMGLGKTIQALAFLTDRANMGAALVAAPASVCRNWRAEVGRFAPKLTPHIFGENDRATTIKKAKKGDLVIVTYDLMAREDKLFSEKEWATIILDEAQAIKNRSTKRSEVAMQLKGGFKLAMSGTPIENHLGELWNLFQFINPGLLGSIESFSERFSGPIEKYKDENRREQLKRLVQPFILRRRKDEVLKDLPAKTEITLSVELPPEERAFYEALRRNAIEKLMATEEDGQAGQQHLRILAEIMKLRRAACHPTLADKASGFKSSAKLDLFSEIVDELLDNGHKALVFSQFVGHLEILEKHLKKKKVKYQYLDGSTPLKKREERIDAFQSGEGDLFLISLKAGGTGLNLTAADYVIHTDPWWNPAVEDQATDRAHRIGQERPVTVYRLVAENTIEEKILELHAKKRDLADSLLSGTDVSAKLTAEDLMGLLRDGVLA